jgi:predicted dehydrogenase/acetyltransferase-like isoleucine patch superfamily enzyme
MRRGRADSMDSPVEEDYFRHETAIVEPGASIGSGTRVWAGAQVREGARIGQDCVLGKDVFIDTGVTIGDRVKVQNGVSVYRGVTIEDEVFVGPGVVFTNDKYPRVTGDWCPLPTIVRKGASLGANSTILPGVTIGEGAMVGAGAVVTRDVAAGETVMGNPARPSPRGDRAPPRSGSSSAGGAHLSVGLVGAGNMGLKHSRVLGSLRLPDVRFVALYDVDRARAEAAAQVGRDVLVTSDLEQLLELCQAVIVAVPTSLHFEVTEQALKAGCHVLLEKPATADPSLLKRLESMAAHRKLVLQVGFVERYNPALWGLLERVGPDDAVVAVEARRLGGPARPHGAGDACDDRRSAVVWDLMIHDLDLLMALAGDDRAETASSVLDEGWGAAVLTMSNGVKACLEAAYVCQDKVRQIRVFTPEVTYEVDYLANRLTVYSRGQASYEYGVCLQSVRQEMTVARHGEPLRLQAEAFLTRCLGGAEAVSPLNRFSPPTAVLRLAGCLAGVSARPRASPNSASHTMV